MARDYAAIYTAVWTDKDWRRLDCHLQHTYWLILTQPRLSPCGVLDFIPHRFVGLAADLTAAQLASRVDELCVTEPRPWLIHDPDTMELLARSFVRYDSLMKVPSAAKAVAKDFAAIASPAIRDGVLTELIRLHRDDPGLAGWKGIAAQDPALMADIEGALDVR